MAKPAPMIMLNRTIREINLKCQVDSNPEGVIVWFKNLNQIIHIGENLRLLRSNESSMQGEYTCIARVEGFNEISATTSVLILENGLLKYDFY